MQCQTVLAGTECTFWEKMAVSLKATPVSRLWNNVKDASASLKAASAKFARWLPHPLRNGRSICVTSQPIKKSTRKSWNCVSTR